MATGFASKKTCPERRTAKNGVGEIGRTTARFAAPLSAPVAGERFRSREGLGRRHPQLPAHHDLLALRGEDWQVGSARWPLDGFRVRFGVSQRFLVQPKLPCDVDLQVNVGGMAASTSKAPVRRKESVIDRAAQVAQGRHARGIGELTPP